MRASFRSLCRNLLLPVLGIFASLLQSPAQAEDTEIVFGLIPALSAEVMVQRYQPLALHLSNEVGVPISLAGARDYETYMHRVLEGSHFDMIITGGDFYHLAERRAGYRAIVRVDGPGVQAILIAAKGDTVASLDDLPQGLRIASVGELSLMYRLGDQLLREKGIMIGENATLVLTPSHNAAMHSLLSDRADVAIIAAPFFNRVRPDIRDRIVILGQSAFAPHHPVSISPDVPDEIAIRLTKAMLALSETPEGQSALEAMSFPGFVVPEPGLYDVMDWAADDLEGFLGLETD